MQKDYTCSRAIRVKGYRFVEDHFYSHIFHEAVTAAVAAAAAAVAAMAKRICFPCN